MKRKRPLGQNFLSDLHTAHEIVRMAQIDKTSYVVEIGPGKGVLTYDLVPQAKHVTALEIDPRLCHLLQKKFSDFPGFELKEIDALKFDFGSIKSRYKVVSNLPYYAAVPILKRLIHYRAHITDMTLMVQKEVADRLVAEPNSRAYGSLSVFTQFHCEVERLMEVKKDCFEPPPKVDSTVVRFVPRPSAPVEVSDIKTYFHIVNAAFFHKRKMLKNNLRALHKHFLLDFDKIESAGIDLSRRAETLSLSDFAVISNLVDVRDD